MKYQNEVLQEIIELVDILTYNNLTWDTIGENIALHDRHEQITHEFLECYKYKYIQMDENKVNVNRDLVSCQEYMLMVFPLSEKILAKVSCLEKIIKKYVSDYLTLKEKKTVWKQRKLGYEKTHLL